ncbi:MAG TPA: molybdopterin-dependent oxidoreductase [Nitrospira sp.]|nr:molybdopterin-dependent oxidoreductase [Nitrospira sp.]
MPTLSRRNVLKAFGAVTLLYWLRPFPASAGFLGHLFAHEGRKTKPITPNEEFYVTSYRSPPTIRLHDWSLSLKGLVNRPITLTYEQLIEKPAVSHIVTLECVGNTIGGESISTAEWTGVPLRSLLEEFGISDRAYDVVFRAADGFSDSITVDRAMAGDVMIAYKMNGVPLPHGHGFPARVIVPGHYGMKSVQWLTEIELVDYDYKGYYQKKGWTETAAVKTMSRIDVPGHGTSMQGLQHKIEGLAFAGSRGIRLVEVSTDGGSHWSAANLASPLSPYAWVFWSYDWTVPAAGRYTLLVRATDGTDSLQPSAEQDSSPDGASGLHEITITVVA